MVRQKAGASSLSRSRASVGRNGLKRKEGEEQHLGGKQSVFWGAFYFAVGPPPHRELSWATLPGRRN